MWPRQRDLVKYYGKVGTNQTRVKVPWTLYLAWNKLIKVNTITVHEKCADSCKRVLDRIADHYTPEEIVANGYHLFGGSLNVRRMRGGRQWSTHAWGIAIDWDPIRNQLKWDHTQAHLAKPSSEKFWQLWEEEGWLSLGRARDFDWMHVQAARL
jgi:hypothetical protein